MPKSPGECLARRIAHAIRGSDPAVLDLSTARVPELAAPLRLALSSLAQRQSGQALRLTPADLPPLPF